MINNKLKSPKHSSTEFQSGILVFDLCVAIYRGVLSLIVEVRSDLLIISSAQIATIKDNKLFVSHFPVAGPTIKEPTQEGDQDIYGDAEVVAGESEDYKALKQMWIHELNTTELCRYDEEFMDVLLELMRDTEKDLEDLEKGDEDAADPTLASIGAHICKMDLDRMSFLLADFMRVRLEKIERYALHNRDFHDLMSKREVRVCKKI